MKRLLGIAMLLLLALGLTCAKAAEKDLYIDGNVQRIFTSEDGLLSTSTQAIAQTSEGFVWIGGYGGLARYDGRRFVTFKDIYKRISRISDLAAGQEGELWIATSDKGLFRYQYGSFDAVCDGDGEVVQGINCLGLSPEGTLYLGMDSGLRVVEDGVVRALEIPGLAEEDVDRILCEADGRVLCLTHSGRLYVWDGHELIWVKAAKEFALRSVCYDAAHDAYRAGTSDNEVLTLDRDLHLVGSTSLAGLSCINDLRCDDSGALWLCADNGIGIYVKGSVRMQNLQMNNSVDKMMVDREGNYWFVSSRQGVLEVSRSKFGDVSRSAGLPSMVVNAIQRLDDTLYIGHDSGLEAISAVNFNRVSDPQLARLGDTRVRALLVDDVGNLWIGTMKKGLLRYVPGGEIVSYTTDNCPALASDNVRSIRSTDEGLLIGTDRGAYLVDGDGVRNVSKDPDALDFRILCAMKYGDTLCLGSDGNGLYLLKDGEIARHITTDDGLSSNVIMKAYWSQACRGLWLVTGNDIDFLGEDGAITSLSNFPTTNNLDIAIMQNGDAWIFTGSGIYQTVEASLLTDAEPRYLQFRHVDGLPYEVTPNSYQCMTGDTLYVCGSGGVFSLQTDFGQAETGSYQLTVDSVVADGQTLYVRPGEACQIDPGVSASTSTPTC